MANRGRVGRNALCPCGSGKKHKKCCIERNPGNSKVSRLIRKVIEDKRGDTTFQKEAKKLMFLQDSNFVPVPGDPKKTLVHELMSLIKDLMNKTEDLVDDYPTSFNHPAIVERVVEIGQELWELTKEKDPEFMLFLFRIFFVQFPKSFASDLLVIWDGIGYINAEDLDLIDNPLERD